MGRSYISSGLATLIILIQAATCMNSNYFAAKPIPKETSRQFIKTSCAATTYPDLCFNTLSRYADKIQTNSKLLAITSLSVSLDTTRSTLAIVTKLSKSQGLERREAAALRDCVEQLSDSVDEIHGSIGEMDSAMGKSFALRMSDIQTWVSAALTNEDTCLDGFSGNVRPIVRTHVVNAAHITSIALALVNRYAATA